MKYYHISVAMPEKEYGELFGFGKNSPGQQVQRYNKLLAKGMVSNGCDLTMISTPPLSRQQRFFRKTRISDTYEDGLSYHFLKVLNIPILKNLFAWLQGYNSIKNAVSKYGSANLRISCDLLALSASLGALCAANKKGVKTIGVVTDIPIFLSGKPSSRFYGWLFTKALKRCRGLIAINKKTAEKLLSDSRLNRPYDFIEGIASDDFASLSSHDAIIPGVDFSQKTILYAGGLEPEFGLLTLIDAFRDAKIPAATLIICGSGSLSDEISLIAAENPSIVFAGVLPNSTVRAAEQKSTLLVNPRPSTYKFTEYSFPSKNMEYLSSGTPMLAYMLPGMPEEYRQYMIIPEGEDEQALSNSLADTLSMSDEKLCEIGEVAKEFVLKNKNPSIQSSKLISLFERL